MTNSTTTTKSGSNQKSRKTTTDKEKSGGNPVKDVAVAARETAEATIGTVRDTAQVAIDKAHETGQQFYDDGSQLMSTAQSELNRTVRNNPTAAVLGALGLGVVIGLALKQRA